MKRTRPGFAHWKAVVSIALSVVLLWLAFRNTDLREVVREIRAADPLPLLAAAFFATFVFWIRAWRWRVLLQPIRPDTAFQSRLSSVMIGFMVNNVVAARVGEFARAFALSRQEPVPLVASFSTLVLERLFDAVLCIGLLFVALALPGFPGLSAGGSVDYLAVARAVAFVVGLVLGALVLVVAWPTRTVALAEAVANRVLPNRMRRLVIDSLEAFLAGIGVLRNPGLVVRTAAWSLFLWFVNSLGFWAASYAFGIDLPIAGALFLNGAVALAVAVPSAPGFFGPFELAVNVVLVQLWGYEASLAVGYAIAFHIVGYIPVTLIGIWYASRLGLSVRRMADTEREVEEAVERAGGAEPERG